MSDESASVKPSPLPDIGDILFVSVMQLLLVTIPEFLFNDGSTGWHLLTGRYILDKFGVPTVDFISYTKAGVPWVAYEWLSDLIMAAINAVAGLNGVAVFVAALIAATTLVVYERCRAVGLNFAMSTLVTMLGAIASSVHWLARPHLFTTVGVLYYSLVLESYRRGRFSSRQLVALLALPMVAWANLHPAFIFGLGLIGIYIVCQAALLYLGLGGEQPARLKGLVLAFFASAAASLVNPYGFALWAYIGQYLKGRSILAQTDEFRPPAFSASPQPLSLEILLLLMFLGALLSRRRPALAPTVSVLVFTGMALLSIRNVPLFAVLAVPFIAELWSDVALVPDSKAGSLPSWWQKVSESLSRISARIDAQEKTCKMHLLPLLYVAAVFVLALNGGQFMGKSVLSSGFDGKRFPVDTLNCIENLQLAENRGFNLDNWGGYIAFKTGRRVYIDDRADFYGERFYMKYGKIVWTNPGWSDALKDEGIQWVLMPHNAVLAMRLSEDPAWTLACRDRAASLFVRK